jgi:Ca-activated chloride channel family protein
LIVVVAAIMAWQQGTDFFVTPDQRGQRLMNQQEYVQAAETFVDPMRQGAAYYRAGDFKTAASVFAGCAGPEAAFNHGNALVMLGKYDQAVASYDQALELRPGWQAAQKNREIARGRAERVKFEGGDMTGGELGADEIVFDLNPNTAGAGEEIVEDGKELSDEELRAMWLRQVQTTPADFLKAKFAYQQATRQKDTGSEDD